MRRALVATVIAGVIALTPAIASAQEAGPETTVVVETSTVEQQVPVVTTETRDVDDDDDDSDKTGLWGLLGLLGLAGLAGLKRNKNDALGPQTGSVRADTTPRGSSSSDH